MFIESQLKALGLVLAAALLVACSSAENISSGQVGSDDTNNSDTNNGDTNDSVNTAPTANAGADQQVDIGATVTLDASASSDSDGSILSYHWRQTAGVAVSIADANSQITTFIVPESALDSNLSFELVVVDDDDTYANDSLIIVVSATDNNPDDSVPVADGGADQRVNEGATVTLDASASSASGGSIATYQWTQIDGAAVALNNATSAQATFEAPQVDSDVNLIFRLTVTNTNDAFDTDNVVITILNNAAPTAQASAISQAYEDDSVELDGSASVDTDGSIVAYLWTQTAGPTASIADADAERTTFIAPAVDGDTALTFQLTVTDNDGAQSTDTISITILDNAAPTAQASAAAQAYEGTTVQLDGSASADSDGSIASYSWQQIDSSGYSVTLSNTAIAQPTFTAPAVAADTNLIFQLTVTDNDGAQGSATVTITILYNNPPTANAGANQSVNEAATVQLDASASSDLEDEDSSLTYSWLQVDSSGYTITLSDANSATPSFTAPNPAANTDLIFQLTVTDSLGKSSDANATITVIYNNPPAANAGANQSVNEGATVQLDASASSDIEDTSLTYSWQQFDSSGYTITLSDANIANPTFTAPNPAANTDLIFQLTVTDSLGKSSDANVTITVLYNNPPEANAGANQSVNEGTTVQLDASASSDLEDSSLTYSWQQFDSSGYTITLSDANIANPTFTAPNPVANTDLIFQLTVTDSLGKSSDANLTITVLYNNPPTANAGANQSVNENQLVQLDGSASSDLEDQDSGLTYSWQQFDSSGYTITLSDATAATPSFTTPEVTADTALTFNLKVTDSLGKTNQDVVVITVLYNNPPEAKAGGNQSVNEGVTVQLDGSASSDLEDEASSLAYSWQQVDDSAFTITLSDANIANPTFTTPNPVETTTDFVFQLTVTDSLGKSSEDSVIIRVTYNNPPEANAGGNQSVNEGVTVQLDGSASSDSETSNLAYSWQQFDSSGYTITLSDATAATPSFTTPEVTADTALTFNLKVTDSLGKTDQDAVVITVLYNNPPEAKAGGDQSVNEGVTVQLDGSASSDIEDEASSLAYSWQQFDSSGYTITLSDATAATPSFTTPNPVAADTALTFNLKVTDSLGKTDQDAVVITVLYNNPPEANAGADQEVDEFQLIQLDASASSDPEDEDSSLAYLWQRADDKDHYVTTLSDSTTANPTFTVPEVDADTELIFQLTVTDSLGKSSDANVTISIIFNKKPSADPGDRRSVDEGTLVQLDGSGSSDSDGFIASYFWEQSDSSGYSVTLSDPNIVDPTFTAPEVDAPTSLAFKLIVTDDGGKTRSATVTIDVQDNSPPSANAGADQQVNEGDSVQLDGSASEDTDGSIASYFWEQIDSSGYTITLSDPNIINPTFTVPEVAADTSLIFQLTVTDDDGSEDSANVTITVIYNSPPTANAGSGAIVDENQFIELDGSGSSDPEGGSLDYLWQQVDDSGFTITLSDDEIAQPTFTTPYVETTTDLSFQLTVTDAGSKSSSDTISFRILYNHPPNANAGADQEVDEGATVQLDASASSDIEDEDTSLAYSWQQVDSSGYTISLSGANTANPSFNAPEVAADTDLIFQLTVTDSLGKTGEDTVTITVLYNDPPEADAGSDNVVDENQVVQLDGSASSDSEDSSLTYSWQQVDSSGYTISLSGATTATPSFTTPYVETTTDLVFQLTVTDSLGKTDQDSVTIRVTYNRPPEANAGADQEVNEGAIVQLDASASSDFEDQDSSLAYSWQQSDSSGYTITLSDANSATPSFTAPNPAATTALTFNLTVTDSLGKSDQDAVIITVLNNTPPTANAGSYQSVAEGSPVQLDGSASSDFEDEDSSLAYYWQQVDSSGYTITLSDPAIAKPTFTAPRVSTDTDLAFELTVTDAGGKSSTDTVTITVLNAPTLTVDASIDNSQAAGTIASLLGSTSSSSNFIASYLWQETTSHGIAIDRADSVNASFVVPASLTADEVISFQFTVTDTTGASASATTSITIATPGDPKWHYDIASRVRSSPAIGADGTVYFGANDGNLYALNPQDGSLKWSFATGGAIGTPPTIAADGTVYFGSDDNHLYAVSPPADVSQSGVEKWHYDTGAVFDEHSSVSIAADGTIHFGNRANYLYAFDPDGSEQWSYQTGSSIAAAPAISSTGTIYFGSGDQLIYAINPPSGSANEPSLLWSYNTGSFLTWTSPAIGADDTVYNGSRGGTLLALNSDTPTLQWSYKAGVDDIRTSPAIAANGTVYFGSRDYYLYALDPDNSSTYKWRYQTGGYIDSSPAIGADGAVYFGSDDDHVYALAPDGSYQWRYDLGSNVDYSSVALAPDGTLYIGAGDGLYAIHTASAGLMDSPWPKFGQNNRSTGRVNLAPSADAGSEQTVAPGDIVKLDASASSDSDGTIIDYYWQETSGYGINIIGNSGAQASFTAPTPSADDTLTIELTVTDDHGTTATTTLNINIQL